MSDYNTSHETLKTEILDSPKSPTFHLSNCSAETEKTEILELSSSPNVSTIMQKLHRYKAPTVERIPTSKYRANNSNGCDSPTCKLELFGNDDSSSTTVVATATDTATEKKIDPKTVGQ